MSRIQKARANNGLDDPERRDHASENHVNYQEAMEGVIILNQCVAYENQRKVIEVDLEPQQSVKEARREGVEDLDDPQHEE